MNLKFNDEFYEYMQNLFNQLDPEEAIFMNHYQLAHATGEPADKWKKFLMEPQVATWLQQELQLYKEYQLKQMIKNATDNEKSVGAAQMINSLQKLMTEGRVKEGPIIIYTHVPLTEPQKQGSKIQHIELQENILIGEWEDEDA